MSADIWTLGEPWLDVLPVSLSVQLTKSLPPSGVIAVARLDGLAMSDSDDVFRQFSETLSFPAYFGWNWDALSDCLRDLSWCPADFYLIAIDNAEYVLVGSAEERSLMFGILEQAAREWASPLGKKGGIGIAFKVLLVCADEAVESMRAEVSVRLP